FMIGYLTQRLSMSRTEALTGVMIAAMVMCFFIPFFGRMSDLMGRARVYRWGSLICGVSVLPAFWLMETQAGNTLAVWLGVV
ncbi:MFS transporter, partial [Escherichia coli]|nr:MFS transporter [Escherichia coli]